MGGRCWEGVDWDLGTLPGKQPQWSLKPISPVMDELGLSNVMNAALGLVVFPGFLLPSGCFMSCI